MVTKTLIDPPAHGSLSTFLFFAHLDVIYDLYPNRHTTKHNKVVTKENMGQRGKIRALHCFLLVVKSNIDDIPLFVENTLQ